jgi:signal transduction histidine kinase
MADAEALLEIASAQLAVAARNVANANAAEREYRRAVWHYTQLMKHRISNPLQTIIGMADTLRDMPDLERSRRLAMIEAIGQQARVLRDVSLEPHTVAPTEHALRPTPMQAAVRMHEQRAHDPGLHVVREESTDTSVETTQRRSPFSRFRPVESRREDGDPDDPAE